MSAIGKGQGQGQGLKSMSTIQETQAMNKNLLVLAKGHMQANIPCFSSTEEVVQYIQTVGKSDLGKERGLRDMCSFEDAENEERSFHLNAHYASQSMPRPSNCTKSDSTMSAAQGLRTMNKKLLVPEKEHMQADIPVSPSTDQVMLSTQTVGRSALGKGRGRLRSMCYFEDAENEEGSFLQNSQYASQNIPRPSKNTRSDSTISVAQGLRTMNKKLFVQEKEHMQEDIPISPSTDQVMQSTQTVGTSSLGKGRGGLDLCAPLKTLKM